MSYVRVKNGEIIHRTESLPTNWENISNFNLLEESEVIQYGWFPYTFVEAEKSDGDISDGSTYSIEEDRVIEYEQVRKKTTEEIQSELESMWHQVRVQRNILLSETDWTQLSDSPLSPEMKIEWQEYRQKLRDITAEPSPYGLGWPSKPGN